MIGRLSPMGVIWAREGLLLIGGAVKLATWNCRIGGFRKKAKHVAPLRPDVLVVQEVEPLDSVLLFAGEHQPTFRDRSYYPSSPRRGIAVLSYTGANIRSVDCEEPIHGFRRYEVRHGSLAFNVVGVWTAVTESRETSYQQAHHGIRRNAEWIRQRPTVILGDFNDNASFKSGNWRHLRQLMESVGLVSAYHQYFREPFGAESRATHFHGGKAAAPFHLDYCFLPSAWAKRVTRVDVGSYEHWHEVSDHVPVVVDIDVESGRLRSA